MPLIHPIPPVTPARLMARPDTPAPQYAVQTAQSVTQTDARTNETKGQAVAPAAPPSVLQMQIKALISEQGQPREDPSQSQSEARS